MVKQLTHTGRLTGDARTGKSRPIVLLRETKLHWITECGTKYRKSNGREVTDDSWPLWWLDLDSIRPCR